jgi:hypothetical protein
MKERLEDSLTTKTLTTTTTIQILIAVTTTILRNKGILRCFKF